MSSSAAPNAAPEGPRFDPAALSESLASAAEKSAKLLGDFLARQAESGKSMLADEFGIAKAFHELTAKMMANPWGLAEAQMTLWWDYMNLWQSSTLKLLGAPTAAIAEPNKGDRRFKHDDWQEHALFDYVKQSYLIASRWLQNAVADVEGLTPETQK